MAQKPRFAKSNVVCHLLIQKPRFAKSNVVCHLLIFDGTTVSLVATPGTPAPGLTTVTATVTGTPAARLFVRVEVTKRGNTIGLISDAI